MPTNTLPHVEELWDQACRLHPDWEHVTWRDPIPAKEFPISSPYWADCETGAQLADLVRVEDLYHHGGWYIDSDMWMLRPLDELCALDAVVGWEDELHIPNAVLGFTAGHPDLMSVLDLAIAKRFQGTWIAGVGVTTAVFRESTVVKLPPGSFYPVHWREAHRGFVNWSEKAKQNPWCYGIHKYFASWH